MRNQMETEQWGNDEGWRSYCGGLRGACEGRKVFPLGVRTCQRWGWNMAKIVENQNQIFLPKTSPGPLYSSHYCTEISFFYCTVGSGFSNLPKSWFQDLLIIMKIPTKTSTLQSGRSLRVMGMFEGCILCPVGIFVFVFVFAAFFVNREEGPKEAIPFVSECPEFKPKII